MRPGPSRTRPHVVELVGPPGAGKTTVLEAMLARGDRVEPKPSFRKFEHAGVVATSIAVAAWTVARHRALGRGVGLGHVLVMAYVEAAARLIERGHSTDATTIAFDQGPIYFACRPALRNPRLAPWRESVFDTWARLLDVVVWLDAPDDALVERINARHTAHRLKDVERETAAKALHADREVYEKAISAVAERRHGPTVLRFDTQRRSAGEIAEVVVSTLAGR